MGIQPCRLDFASHESVHGLQIKVWFFSYTQIEASEHQRCACSMLNAQLDSMYSCFVVESVVASLGCRVLILVSQHVLIVIFSQVNHILPSLSRRSLQANFLKDCMADQS